MPDFILSETRFAVAAIALNRLEVLNAWHAPMRDARVAALDAAEADEAICAIVITGAGERAFVAGQDLTETKAFDPDRAEFWIAAWERRYDRIRSLSKPLRTRRKPSASG
ncbi:enoyl-CoA hydratase/isomerase family protein [Falsiroseomonas oryzae]|uniref:enoyl-CoA hydratase/isomerase family protein n=1 Tax=Falsiroseomonas oryzae TaxID=2766473 RepID=UPI0022EA641D|nr:enoyl-CoA hydratase-related protein [Roseomonas sp. MO-31]